MQLQRGCELAIVCPSDAGPMLRAAATELCQHLEGLDMTAVLRAESGSGAVPEIILAVEADGAGAAGREGGVIQSMGPQRLGITGATERGVLNGVYVFLEELLGVRWLTPEVTFFPLQREFELRDGRVEFKPPFVYRSLLNVNASDLDWTARHRLNYFVDREPDTFLGDPRLRDSFYLAGNQNCHNVYELLVLGTPARTGASVGIEDVFDEHPDYFALLAGVRCFDAAASRRPTVSEQSGQICLTHPDMPRVLARGLRRLSEQDPGAACAALSLRDNYDYCECDSCRAAAARAGGMTAVYFELANRVAAELEPHCPNLIVNLLAYHGTQPPPLNVRLHPKLQIRYCPIRISQYHAFDESEHNTVGGLNYETPPSMARPVPQLRQWRAICDHVMVWYYTLHLPLLHPQPDLRAHDRNLRLMRELGVEGVFAEDLPREPANALNHVRAYVLARLLWNPDLDLDALVREFVTLYYGPAADHVLAYVRLLHDPDVWDWRRWPEADGRSRWEVRDFEESWGWFDETPDPDQYQTPHFFTLYGTRPPLKPDFCRQAWGIMDNAVASSGADAELRARVETVRLPVAYAIHKYLDANDPLQRQAAVVLEPVLESARQRYAHEPAVFARLFGG